MTARRSEGVVLFLLVSVGAGARTLVVFGAVNIRAVVEGAVPLADGPSPSLVQEVPVEAGEGPMLGALVLHKQRTLLRPELLQVSERGNQGAGSTHTKHMNMQIQNTDIGHGCFYFSSYMAGRNMSGPFVNTVLTKATSAHLHHALETRAFDKGGVSVICISCIFILSQKRSSVITHYNYLLPFCILKTCFV